MHAESLEKLRCPCCAPTGRLRAAPLLHAAEDGELLEAVLRCESCARWFRLEEGIADLVRDELREVADDRAFLARHAAAIPGDVLNNGLPFGLEGPTPVPDPDDLNIIEEGRHWGAFMRRFWDVGDRSIFDIRAKGSHPPFFIAGVLEPDDRDSQRRWGIFPNRVGDAIFPPMGRFSGKWGLDIGCGGGQFGLEAANQGVRIIGFDPSFEEVRLAREHARATGVSNIDYVRAEPAHPPFAAGSLDLLLAKDSLHHVPDLAQVFPRILACATESATFICHEHCDKPRLKNRLMAALMPRAIRKIRSRYPKVAVPPELLRDSANEDVSMAEVRRVVAEHFECSTSVECLFLADDLEMMVHFAFGKRRWLSAPAHAVGSVLERLFLLLGDRQHWAFVGRRRRARRGQ